MAARVVAIGITAWIATRTTWIATSQVTWTIIIQVTWIMTWIAVILAARIVIPRGIPGVIPGAAPGMAPSVPPVSAESPESIEITGLRAAGGQVLNLDIRGSAGWPHAAA